MRKRLASCLQKSRLNLEQHSDGCRRAEDWNALDGWSDVETEVDGGWIDRVDPNTLQVVDVISYQKQIIGHQISAGVFDFLGANFFDASVGESALEPIQLAVRSVVERATLEMMVRLYHTGGTCSAVTDPLADSTEHLTPAVEHAPAPVAAPTVATTTPALPATNAAPEATITARNEDHPNADASRDHPYHFYNASDVNAPSLRGSQ